MSQKADSHLTKVRREMGGGEGGMKFQTGPMSNRLESSAQTCPS